MVPARCRDAVEHSVGRHERRRCGAAPRAAAAFAKAAVGKYDAHCCGARDLAAVVRSRHAAAEEDVSLLHRNVESIRVRCIERLERKEEAAATGAAAAATAHRVRVTVECDEIERAAPLRPVACDEVPSVSETGASRVKRLRAALGEIEQRDPQRRAPPH